MTSNQIVYLEITSWYGISIGAEHYYGKLSGSDTVVELERTLTSRQAKELNKKDSMKYLKEGSKTGRFDTKEEIIEVALFEYKKHFPDAKILILGRSSLAEPQKILDAPKQIRDKGNLLFAETEKIEWIEKYGFYYRTKEDEKKIDALSRKWD